MKDVQVEVIINELCTNMFSDDERLRDISSVGRYSIPIAMSPNYWWVWFVNRTKDSHSTVASSWAGNGEHSLQEYHWTAGWVNWEPCKWLNANIA